MRKIAQLFSNIYVYAILGIICSFYFCCSTTISEGEIRYNQNNLPTNYILIGKENILWDTGAQRSTFLQNFVVRKIFLYPVTMFDTHGHRSWEWFYYSPSMRFDLICINNIAYNLVNEDKVAAWLRNLNIMGILGMNVISRANWLIDFTDTTLHIMNRNDELPVTDIPKLSLTYKKDRTPETTLTIAGIAINDVLIDSGCNVDMTLFEKDIEQINRYILPIDTAATSSSGLYTEDIPGKMYIYHNITINGYAFDKMEIVESNTRRLIGMGFFQKFDKVFLNTKKKEFQFYRFYCADCSACKAINKK